jgi:hypothetical protein
VFALYLNMNGTDLKRFFGSGWVKGTLLKPRYCEPDFLRNDRILLANL